MLFLNLPAFESKKYAAYDRFHGNGPYGEIPTKKEPIRTLGFALPYNNGFYFCFMLDRRLYFSISAYAALKNEHPDLFVQRKLHWPLSQCHTSCNVTNYHLWRGRRQVPPSGAPINRFGKKSSCQN